MRCIGRGVQGVGKNIIYCGRRVWKAVKHDLRIIRRRDIEPATLNQTSAGFQGVKTIYKNMKIALMRVFPEVIVLTTKPRIEAYVLFT